MDPLTTSTLISTGGSLLSGLFGKKQKKPDYNAMFEMENTFRDKAFRTEMATKMELGQQYGFHPLTMLGTSGPQISAPVYESKSSDNMGQNVINSLTKGASDYYTGKANKIMEDLALERARLENDLLRSQITSINRPASTTIGALDQTIDQNPTDNRYPKQAQMPLGFGDTAPFMKQAIDKNGNTMDVYNEEGLGDNDVLAALTSLGITVPQWLANNVIMKSEEARITNLAARQQKLRAKKAKQTKWAHEYKKTYGPTGIPRKRGQHLP